MIAAIPNLGIRLTHQLLECKDLFIQLSSRTIRSLLRDKNFIATEQEIYSRCLDWARHQSQMAIERASNASTSSTFLSTGVASDSERASEPGTPATPGTPGTPTTPGTPGTPDTIEQKRKNTSSYLNYIKKLKYDIRMPLLGLKFYQKKLANKRVLTKEEETLLTKYWKAQEKARKTGDTSKLSADSNLVKKISQRWPNYRHRHPFLNLKQNSKLDLNLSEVIGLTELVDNKSLFDVNSIRLNLLYCGSDNKFSAETFHSNCDDNIFPTLVLIKSGKYNNIFGGFTCEKWKGYGYTKDKHAFIFLLRRANDSPVTDDNNANIKLPCKWGVIESKLANSIYRNEKYGPRFGEGADICIVDQCNEEPGSYASIGDTYDAPKDSLLMAGEKKFLIEEYEVWAIMP